MGEALASLGQGMDNAVQGTQQAFRTLLAAMSHPGRVQAMPAAALAGVQPPASQHAEHPFGLAMTAALLSLLDPDAPLHLHAPLHSASAAAYFRFHCGAVLAEVPRATLVAARAADLNAGLWTALAQGSDEAPQDGSTLLVEVAGLDEQQPLPAAALLHLTGPGIARLQTLVVAGLPPAFWHWRRELQRHSPRGVDLLLCCGPRIAAIPRSSQLSLEV
jgi:alpha-D-ribose 1-methylphosphonate 5-triphosphate synthase subunit PhnH